MAVVACGLAFFVTLSLKWNSIQDQTKEPDAGGEALAIMDMGQGTITPVVTEMKAK